MSSSKLLSQPFSITWRKALVSLPRLVPLAALKYTSSEGPHPFIYQLPSRGKYTIPLYIFVPTNITPFQAQALPIVIDFHGGGFVLGSCFEQAPFCAKLARDLGAVVMTVDYRMGPIDKFPAATQDAEDVLSAVLDENAPGYKELRLAIGMKITGEWKKQERRRKADDIRVNESAKSTDENLANRTEQKKIPTIEISDSDADADTLSTLNPSLSRTPTKELPDFARAKSSDSLALVRTDSGKIRPKLKRLGSKRPKIKRFSSQSSLSSMSSKSSKKSKKVPKDGFKGIVDLDTTRIAISGFSSGGNLALGMGQSCGPPQIESDWPCIFPPDYAAKIALLLYYPSFDCRQLPGERPQPPGMSVAKGFWDQCNDMLMPTYLPRDKASHPRASPGLADLNGLHPQARMFLVLPEMDTLSEQSELWVNTVEASERKEHLRVERYKGMKHGWTQMPEGWLSDEEKKTRLDALDKAVAFTKETWQIGRKYDRHDTFCGVGNTRH